jgi:copper chaperone CopZ
MSCGGCESSVETVVGKLDGVERVGADNESGTVAVDGEYDEASVRNAIEGAGFTVSA